MSCLYRDCYGGLFSDKLKPSMLSKWTWSAVGRMPAYWIQRCEGTVAALACRCKLKWMFSRQYQPLLRIKIERRQLMLPSVTCFMFKGPKSLQPPQLAGKFRPPTAQSAATTLQPCFSLQFDTTRGRPGPPGYIPRISAVFF